MKKLLLIPGILIAVQVGAQVPKNTSIPIVQKATATWCGPCGDWGWTLQEEIITDNEAKAPVIACYGSSSSDLYNQAAYDLTSWGQSWPNWGMNNINRTAFSSSGGIYGSTTRTTVKNAVDSFAATSPVASTGYVVSLTGNTINVKTKTKFWQAASGEYYVAVYMIEDGVMNTQNGQTGVVAHHNVLRGSMTASTWGQMIASGSISANQTYDKDFTFTITDPTWVKNKMTMITVIWKKNGSKYDFINANNKKDAAASVANVEAVDGLMISPNPASGFITVSGKLNTYSNAKINIVNALGQVVFTQSNIGNKGQLHEQIDISRLSNGMYLLQIVSDAAVSTEKFTVNR